MVTPLQIDSFTRDLWNEFDALAIAQLAPLAFDDCYKPRIYVGLDSDAQSVAALGYSSFGLQVTPGSLIYGFYMGTPVIPSPWNFQMTDMSLGRSLFSDPVSQIFLSNLKGPAYPWLLCAPYPVVGSGMFLVEVWSQLATTQSVIPLIGVLEAR
jgi:hypothetical protein